MTDERKLELLEDMMDQDPGTLHPETVLNELGAWDSVALISFMALVDDEFGKELPAETVREQRTVADLMSLMEE